MSRNTCSACPAPSETRGIEDRPVDVPSLQADLQGDGRSVDDPVLQTHHFLARRDEPFRAGACNMPAFKAEDVVQRFFQCAAVVSSDRQKRARHLGRARVRWPERSPRGLHPAASRASSARHLCRNLPVNLQCRWNKVGYGRLGNDKSKAAKSRPSGLLGACRTIYDRVIGRMVGVTGIEPVTPTMST